MLESPRNRGGWAARLVQQLERNPRAAVAMILVLAAATRAQAVIRYPADLSGDSGLYDMLARSLIGGLGYAWAGGMPTAVVPPGYPVFLAAVFALLRPDPIAAYFVQVILGAVSVLLVALLARLCLDTRHALVAGFIAALYPAFYWLPRRLVSENLALPLALGALCAAALTLSRRSHKWATVAGVLVGSGIIVRGAGVFLGASVVAGMALIGAKGVSRLKAGALATTTAVACILSTLPWLVRNAAVLGAPVLSTQSGLTLYSSYWPPVRGGRRIWGNNANAEDPEIKRAYALNGEVASSRHLASVVISRLRRHPTYPVVLIPEKVAALLVPFDWEIIPPEAGQTKSTSFAYLILILPAVAGASRLLRSPPGLVWLIWAMPAATLAQAVVFYGSPRFRLMAEPSLVIFAAAGVIAWLHRGKSSADASESLPCPTAPTSSLPHAT